MIASVEGTIEEIGESSAVINVGGFGVEVQIPQTAGSELARKGVGEHAKLYTYLYLREDMAALYGFLSRDDLSLFKKLITVSGIGPKAGLSLLSAMSADDLIFAVLSGDVKTISRAPGVGKKTAERLVLDLKDKLELAAGTDFSGSAGEEAKDGQVPGEDQAFTDAVSALTALGYGRPDAVRAVKKARTGGAEDTEQLLKGALGYL